MPLQVSARYGILRMATGTTWSADSTPSRTSSQSGSTASAQTAPWGIAKRKTLGGEDRLRTLSARMATARAQQTPRPLRRQSRLRECSNHARATCSHVITSNCAMLAKYCICALEARQSHFCLVPTTATWTKSRSTPLHCQTARFGLISRPQSSSTSHTPLPRAPPRHHPPLSQVAG